MTVRGLGLGQIVKSFYDNDGLGLGQIVRSFYDGEGIRAWTDSLVIL